MNESLKLMVETIVTLKESILTLEKILADKEALIKSKDERIAYLQGYRDCLLKYKEPIKSK